MTKDCFSCKNRKQGTQCPYISECLNNVKDHFEPKEGAKTRADMLRSMDNNSLAEFICSLRPDMKDKAPELKKYVLNWLEEPATNSNPRCWFMR